MKPRVFWYILSGCVLLTILILFEFKSTPEPRISFLDVGQGDAILLTSETGKRFLIDAGPTRQVLGPLTRELGFFTRTLDIALTTHDDADHIGGMPAVLSKYTVGSIILNDTVASTSLEENLVELSSREGVTTSLTQGDTITLSDNMNATVLYPLRQIPESETNLSSYVLKVTFGSDCAILTGDAPESIENFLVDMYGDELHCKLLKAGHHGSRTSTSERFLATVKPEWVVISAGKNNSYGHPHREVIDRVVNRKIQLLETAQEGTITFRIREGKLVLDK